MSHGIIDYFKDYVGYDAVNNIYPIQGVIKFVIDALLVLVLVIFLIGFLVKHTKSRKTLVLTILYIVLFFVVTTFGLKLFQMCLSIGALIYLGILVVNYAPEVKSHYTGLLRTKGEKGFITSEQTKEALIDQLIKTVEYLTSRQIGAIITIEKENSLNTYIEKSTKIEALVSFELLATIFWPNTALHDGGVIIRGDQIMCAGAFYPSSANADIPKQYGSRHRAALGISEVSDAFTIVLSEETGNIATTIAGTITSKVSLEGLRVSLNQNIIVK